MQDFNVNFDPTKGIGGVQPTMPQQTAKNEKKEPVIEFVQKETTSITGKEAREAIKKLKPEIDELTKQKEKARQELVDFLKANPTKPTEEAQKTEYNEKLNSLNGDIKELDKQIQAKKEEMAPYLQALKGTEEELDLYNETYRMSHGEPQSRAEIREGANGSWSEVTRLRKEIAEAEKEEKALRKEFKDAPRGSAEKAQLREELSKAESRVRELKSQEEKAVIRYRASAVEWGVSRRIANAQKRNKKTQDNVAEVNQKIMVTSKADRKAMMEADSNLKKDDFVILDNDDLDALDGIQMWAKAQLAELSKYNDIHKTDKDGNPTKEIDYDKVKALGINKDFVKRLESAASVITYEPVLDADGKQVLDENGNPKFTEKIDMQKAQNAIGTITGYDNRLNADEKAVAAAQTYVDKGDIADLADHLGFDVESEFWLRAGAAGAAFGSALAGNAINWLLNGTQTGTGTAPYSGEKPVEGFVTYQPEPSFDTTYDSHGTIISQNIIEHDPVQIPYSQIVEYSGEAATEITTKIPFLGELIGPVAAGLAAFALSDPAGLTQDAFKGNVEEALRDLGSVKGNAEKYVVLQIQEMELTGVKDRDDKIKAAVLKAAIGADTKKANLRELQAALDALKHVQAHMDEMDLKKVIEKKMQPEDVTKTVTVEDTKTVTVGGTERPELEVRGGEEIVEDNRTAIKIVPKKTGNYFLSQAYVDENGNDLSPAEKRKIQNYLRKHEVEFEDVNGDKRITTRDNVLLPNEIEINGKKYKLAPDARERIERTPAGTTGHDRTYKISTSVVSRDGKYYVVNKNTGATVDGPFDTREAANKRKAALEEALKPNEE